MLKALAILALVAVVLVSGCTAGPATAPNLTEEEAFGVLEQEAGGLDENVTEEELLELLEQGP